MRSVAYLYFDPVLEPTPDLTIWQIDHVYQDFAIEKSNRSQFQQLIADCETDPIDRLIIRKLAELGDSIEEIQDRLLQLESLNITLITTESENQFEANTLQQLQKLQHDQRSHRIRQGHARNRIKALAPPGKAPYGYRRNRNRYVLDRATAPVVKEFFDRFLLFGSLRGAVRYLEKKYGKKISASTGQHWLTNPVYRGDLAYQNGETIRDAHAAILSRDEAAQIDRLLRRNRRLPSRTASAPRSLAGLVICKQCDSPMTITRTTSRSKNQKEYLYLRPTRCPRQCKAIAYDEVLQATIDTICEALPRAVAGVTMPDLERVKQMIQAEIAQKQAILDELSGLLDRGILDTETMDLRSYKLRTEIAALQNKLAQLPPISLSAIAQTVSIPQFWLDLSESERRFYFREFIRQIDLDREASSPSGNRTDTDWSLKLNFIF